MQVIHELSKHQIVESAADTFRDKYEVGVGINTSNMW